MPVVLWGSEGYMAQGVRACIFFCKQSPCHHRAMWSLSSSVQSVDSKNSPFGEGELCLYQVT